MKSKLNNTQQNLLNRILSDLEELYGSIDPSDIELKDMVFNALDKVTDIDSYLEK